MRPGTLRMCAALASTSSNSSSSTCQTGFQYTPVASIATCVQPCSASQSASASNSVVVLPKLRTSWCMGGETQRTQATMVSLCTSSPAQRV